MQYIYSLVPRPFPAPVFILQAIKTGAGNGLGTRLVYIGSALAEKVGQEEVGGCTPLGDSAWRLLQLAVEKPWSVRRVGQLSAFLHKRVYTMLFSSCRDSISGILGSL